MISSLCEIQLSIESVFIGTNPKVLLRYHPLAVVLSQDCDLDQDFSTRSVQRAPVGNAALNNALSSIIFCEVVTASELRGAGGPDMDSKTWKRVRFNKDERYHFLASVPASADLQGEGLPDLALDFKKYFALPTHVVYWQATVLAKRRCYLVPPYAEHLSARFCSYQSRIALPIDHHRQSDEARPAD